MKMKYKHRPEYIIGYYIDCKKVDDVLLLTLTIEKKYPFVFDTRKRTIKPVKQKKKKELEFDGFSINLTLDDENEWVAHFVELTNVSSAGETIEEALTELRVAWEGMKESYRKHKEPIPKK